MLSHVAAYGCSPRGVGGGGQFVAWSGKAIGTALKTAPIHPFTRACACTTSRAAQNRPSRTLQLPGRDLSPIFETPAAPWRARLPRGRVSGMGSLSSAEAAACHVRLVCGLLKSCWGGFASVSQPVPAWAWPRVGPAREACEFTVVEEGCPPLQKHLRPN